MPTYSPKVLITGKEGQLACALIHHALAAHFQIFAFNRHEMDITNIHAIQQAIKSITPDVIINTAAYTAVDKAEQENQLAEQVNHHGAKYLAMVCSDNHIPLIHLSTDYIFDGKKHEAYHELDEANPINFYGQTKLMGEIAVRKYQRQHIILRVSGVFSEYRNNFLKTILHLAKEKKELRVVSDQITCPTYASDIAKTIFTMLMSKLQWGTYHYCSQAPVSWHQFAVSILNKDILAITTADYPTLAKRPPQSVLNCTKIFHDYGITQPCWESAIKTVLSKLEK